MTSNHNRAQSGLSSSLERFAETKKYAADYNRPKVLGLAEAIDDVMSSALAGMKCRVTHRTATSLSVFPLSRVNLGRRNVWPASSTLAYSSFCSSRIYTPRWPCVVHERRGSRSRSSAGGGVRRLLHVQGCRASRIEKCGGDMKRKKHLHILSLSQKRFNSQFYPTPQMRVQFMGRVHDMPAIRTRAKTK